MIKVFLLGQLARLVRWKNKRKQKAQAEAVLAMGSSFASTVTRTNCPASYKPGLIFAAQMAAEIAGKLNKGEVY